VTKLGPTFFASRQGSAQIVVAFHWHEIRATYFCLDNGEVHKMAVNRASFQGLELFFEMIFHCTLFARGGCSLHKKFAKEVGR
jgi:hypothetical protein